MVDITYYHPKYSNHRPESGQKEFEYFGGTKCNYPGAEKQAAKFLLEARYYLSTGEIDEAEKMLGMAMHFIQDALCPEHIFPFREQKSLGPREPHLSFSIYAWLKYCLSRKWQKAVKDAQVEPISSPEDLENKISEAVDWIRQLPCSYLRQDGEKIENEKTGKISFWGWKMSDEDIQKVLEKTSSLIKGAIIWYEAAET